MLLLIIFMSTANMVTVLIYRLYKQKCYMHHIRMLQSQMRYQYEEIAKMKSYKIYVSIFAIVIMCGQQVINLQQHEGIQKRAILFADTFVLQVSIN